MTEVQSFDSRIGREIEARIRIEFAKRMEPSMLDGLAIQLHIYPELATAEGLLPAADALSKLRPADNRNRVQQGLKRAIDEGDARVVGHLEDALFAPSGALPPDLMNEVTNSW